MYRCGGDDIHHLSYESNLVRIGEQIVWFSRSLAGDLPSRNEHVSVWLKSLRRFISYIYLPDL